MRNNSINAHKEAKNVLCDYSKKKSDYVFIHYARQNCFEDAYEKGPRVIAIVVMNAESGQTIVFSLKKIAERKGKNFFESTEAERDKMEKDMLQNFFDYTKNNSTKKWLHWNMKNNNFGFSAIEERFRNLGGNPEQLDEDRLINISVLLKKKYGTNYAKDNRWNGKMMGKMYDVFVLNNIIDSNILNGEQEIKEYILENISSIEQSILGKIKAFQIILEKAADNDLKTRGNIIKDVYGVSLNGIAEYIQSNALLAILFSIIGGIIVTIVCNFLGL